MSDAKITWQPGDVVKYGDLNPLFVAEIGRAHV